jgi:hypothetical protein
VETPEVCVFITAGPSTKLFASGGGDMGGHVLRKTTSQGLCGLVCPSRTRNSCENSRKSCGNSTPFFWDPVEKMYRGKRILQGKQKTKVSTHRKSAVVQVTGGVYCCAPFLLSDSLGQKGAAPWGRKVRALSFSKECYAVVVCRLLI